ncbi:hypothetical protein LTR36_009098 [Oleoguttula mirabilis]|uniref:Uncharacterized protein n=1 Tax=Oleoguttula mirabilis TaxID=1507867 RepID=A0AAV9J6D0_9PEZI|nr:hypothetical protein LTR36_009098 [Oleoguttula mirabilis]
MTQASARSLASSLDKLQISGSSKTAPHQRMPEPVDSWEDDDSTDTEGDSAALTPVHQVTSSDLPEAPPPTPSSPSFSSSKTTKGLPYQTFPPYGFDGVFDEQDNSARSPPVRAVGEERRPEKSTAVASRLIAAGIGQKAPRRTKEQREYDQAVKVQEKKRRDQAKAEEERKRGESEKAKRAIWEN